MDLFQILRERVEGLAPGDHVAGLQAVLRHIVAAGNHLERGQSTADDSAFTDTIYRCNQAFEGSLKEAYRVLADKDPSRTNPFEIENYLQNAKLLRPRLLKQFTAYRREWRNPSTHDHRLDFDANEALMATVSVAAFGIVLVDQIHEKLRFNAARERAAAPVVLNSSVALGDQVAHALLSFRGEFGSIDGSEPPRSSELVGTLAGHLAASIQAADVVFEMDLPRGKSPRQIDIWVSRGQEQVIVDVRRQPYTTPLVLRSYVSTTVKELMELAGVREAVLYIYAADEPLQQQALSNAYGRVIVVGPKSGFGLEATPV